MKFNKNIFLTLGFVFATLPMSALDQKVKDAAVSIAQHLKKMADESKNADAIKAADAGLKAAQAGDLQIPKPARAPKPDEQKSIDAVTKKYEEALIAYAAAIKASDANKADAGLKKKADDAQTTLTSTEQVLGSTILAIK